MTTEKCKKLSNRLAAMLNLSKRIGIGTEEPTVASISAALEWCYCGNMKLVDALHHTLEAYKEAVSEPRLCMSSKDVLDVIMAPVKGFNSVEPLGPKNMHTKYSIEEFYTAMIKHILGTLMCTRIDWCAVELEAEAREANSFRKMQAERLATDA